MAEPGISVVIPVRNGERFLAEAIQSALAQTRSPLEVIVVDDGSGDGTAEVARRFPVRLVSLAPVGVSAARNAGVAEARGDCLAFLDHDDVWSPLKLERQMAPLEANPELGYTRCRLRVFLEADTPRPAWLEDDFFTQGFVAWCDSSIVVRREAFERVGPFDPEITLGEDADWALRAMDAGVTWELVDEALTRYRVHAHNATHAMRARAVLGLLRKSVVRRRASRADQSAA